MFCHSRFKPASRAELASLEELGIPVSGSLNSEQANNLIQAHFDQWARLPATRKQQSYLRIHGAWTTGMNRGDATRRIGFLKGDNP